MTLPYEIGEMLVNRTSANGVERVRLDYKLASVGSVYRASKRIQLVGSLRVIVFSNEETAYTGQPFSFSMLDSFGNSVLTGQMLLGNSILDYPKITSIESATKPVVLAGEYTVTIESSAGAASGSLTFSLEIV